ncbi:MAG: biliverdin-producing heme oxygenase [Verrucomicrobiota bacterium]
MDSSQSSHNPTEIAPLLLRLRKETRPQHAALERVLGLLDKALSLGTYRQRLEQFYGFYRPVEGHLGALGDWRKRGLDVQERRKVPLLEADLRALGVETPESLPLCTELPDLGGVPEAFGCLYVLEGATLGGQFITEHLQRTLGLGPDNGARFFNSYGERVPEMWRSFGATLVAFASTAEIENAVVSAAGETFESLHRWLEGKDLTSDQNGL